MITSTRVSYIITDMNIGLVTITAEQVTPEILELFDITKPTMPRAFNVLEGLNRGEILVDDPRRPTTAVVRDIIYGTLYIGGDISRPLIASLVGHFRKIGEGASVAGSMTHSMR